jgi:RNA polymerase sigma factor (sigma-70 family)
MRGRAIPILLEPPARAGRPWHRGSDDARATPPANREAIAAMERYCEGDGAAFRELYALTAPRLFSYVLCLVRDRALSEELLQQTFLKLHKSRASYVAGADPLPWLYTIAHHACLDELRRARTRHAAARDRHEHEDPPAMIDGNAQTAQPTYGEHTIDAVLRALEQLPENLRVAVVLTKIQGHSIAEAAAILGTTSTTVKLRAHRGYVKLRALLREPEDAR